MTITYYLKYILKNENLTIKFLYNHQFKVSKVLRDHLHCMNTTNFGEDDVRDQ